MKKTLIPLLGLLLSSGAYANMVNQGEALYCGDQSCYITPVTTHDNGFYLGGSIAFNDTVADSNNQRYLNTNHVGFTLNTGYLFKINQAVSFGLGVQYSKLGNITVNDGQTNTEYRFNNTSMMVSTGYRFTDNISVSGNVGYGFMFGDQTKRWMPLLGVDGEYKLSDHIAMIGSYQHYFGVSDSHSFTTDRAVPDFDVVSVGVRYYF